MDVAHAALVFAFAHVGDFGGRCLATVLWLPALLCGFALIERWSPLVAQGTRPNPTDLKYFLLTPAFDLLSRAGGALWLGGVAMLMGRHIRPELLHGFGPVIRQPTWLIVGEMLLLLELIAYVVHRLFHSVAFLWRFHAVHHSTTRLTWLSAVRRHPVNDLVSHCCNVSVLFCFGFPIDAAMLLLPLIAFHAFLTHANVSWRFSRFAPFIVSPVYHRFHHTTSSEGGHKNFAALLPFTDLLFGTYYLPQAAPRTLGVDETDVPEGLLAQLGYPFRRRGGL
jgi:sterol desaturase/sphingolipid hydroxylase (fatty acid hydroxylase superfamily)